MPTGIGPHVKLWAMVAAVPYTAPATAAAIQERPREIQ
jgi:hypothetical protein